MSYNQVLETTFDIKVPSNNKYLIPSVRYIEKCSVCRGGKAAPYLRQSQESSDFKLAFGAHLKRVAEEINWNADSTKEGFWRLEADIVLSRTNEDPSNIWKILPDSIVEAGIIVDDKNLKVNNGMVTYDSKKQSVTIKLYKDEQVGIFKDLNHLLDFVYDNCESCKKDAKKCSIMKKAKEARSQEEIDLDKMKCSKIKL